MDEVHQPVLAKEVVEYLVTDQAGIYVDGTVGTGGHSLAIGKKLSESGRMICLDRDPDALSVSEKRLAFLGKRLTLVKDNFCRLDQVLSRLGLRMVQGVFLDLGMSSYQIERSGRGFSFNRNEPLDMRMDPETEITAARLVNTLNHRELESLLRRYGEEKRAKSISKAIVHARRRHPIETSGQLAALIESVTPRPRGSKAIHPATRTFQALRIAVNEELQNLKVFLEKIPSLIMGGGRLAILSYHSLEDRLVKQAMVGWEKGCTCPPGFPACVCGKSALFKRIFKKPLRPGAAEVGENPRARSAKLRVAERIPS